MSVLPTELSGTGTVPPHGPGAPPGARRAIARQSERRERIVAVAMEQFAAAGYDKARVEEIAAQAGVSKGAVFGYFKSKSGLFLAAYEAATRSFSTYLEAPEEILAGGFFATVTYWLEHTTHLVKESWVPYRVALLGNYCSDPGLRRAITQFLLREDPYGTRAFVELGIARGEVRRDIDPKVIVPLVDWLMDRCQDAVVTEELDPGLFGANAVSAPERSARFGQFVELLRSAIGAR